jgi:hypothetical protein
MCQSIILRSQLDNRLLIQKIAYYPPVLFEAEPLNIGDRRNGNFFHPSLFCDFSRLGHGYTAHMTLETKCICNPDNNENPRKPLRTKATISKYYTKDDSLFTVVLPNRNQVLYTAETLIRYTNIKQLTLEASINTHTYTRCLHMSCASAPHPCSLMNGSRPFPSLVRLDFKETFQGNGMKHYIFI